MSQAGALTLMTIVALIGVVGSWLIGAIDQKIGTKKTMQGFGIWYAIALVINVLSGGHVGMLFYLSIFMIGMGIGRCGFRDPAGLRVPVHDCHGHRRLRQLHDVTADLHLRKTGL